MIDRSRMDTDLTVAAVVERDGRFLTVEEMTSSRRVLNQPGGHIEHGESPEAAAIRETFEETAWRFEPEALLGVYLWVRRDGRRYLRIAYTGRVTGEAAGTPLDEGIIAAHWLTPAELRAEGPRLRSPMVLRCVEDYLAGERAADATLANLLPLERNLDEVTARAAIV